MAEPVFKQSRHFPPTSLSARTVLVVPDGMADAPSVLSLQRAIARQGKAPDILAQKDFTRDLFRDAQVIACGNMATNAALCRLYTARCCFADTFFPGGAGYLIKSVSDPFGHGVNCITIGASTEEGLSLALPVFEAMVRNSSGALDRVHAARFVHDLPPFPDESELDRLVQADLDTWNGGWASSPFRGGQVSNYAWYAYLTDHPVWTRAIASILTGSIDPWRAQRRESPESYHCFFNLHSFIHLWDLIEDSPLYTDGDRRGVVTLLWDLLRHLGGLFYLREDVNPPGEIRQNHTTFIGLNLAVGHDYMVKRYGIREFVSEAETAERIFAGQADCYKPNDDAGVGYAWHVPQETLFYLLYRDDYRYIENGHVADLCKLAVVTADNMRSEGNYGDTSGYSAFSNRGWDSRLWPLMVSTWYTRNPKHLWALNWLGEGKTPPLSRVPFGLYAGVEWNGGRFSLKGCEPEEPADLLGICAIELPEPVLEWVRNHHPASHHPHPEKTYFDKLSLRRNFDPHDEYLLLEGLGTTCHGHEDSNAIVRLTWKNRAWLGDGDYIRAAPKFHNSIVVARNGVGVLDAPGDGIVIPPVASLNNTNDGPTFSLVQTEASGYNGVNWLRNIFWGKGRYFVVIDRLHCTRAGDYHCRCLWRLVGEVEEKGPDVVLHQQGETFYVRSASGTEQEVVPDFHEKSRWAAYPHADSVLNILHQKSGGMLQNGEDITFVNLLTPHADVRIERLTDLMARVTDGAVQTVLGVGNARLGDLEIEASVFVLCLDGDTLTVQGVDRMAGEDVKGGVQTLDAASDTTARRLAEAIQAASPKPASYGMPFLPHTEGGFHLRWDRQAGAEISAVDVLGEALLAGTGNGEVFQVAVRDGQTSWSHRLDVHPTSLRLADIDSDGEAEALVGTADSHLIALEGQTGAERWRRKLKNMWQRGAKVSDIAVADLEGDGDLSVLAGTEGWYVNAFAADGTPRWANWFRYHAITALTVADADGDGRAEVMAGTEYSTPLTVHNYDGCFRWSTFEEVGSEGNATTPRRGICLTCMQLCDIDGDGVREIIYGTADGWIYAVKPQDGTGVWHINIAGEVRGLAVFPDILIGANEYGRLYGFGHRGEMLWQAQAAEWIRAVVPVGKHSVIAAENGQLLAYDLQGACVGSTTVSGAIRGLWACDEGVVCSTAGGGLRYFEHASH